MSILPPREHFAVSGDIGCHIWGYVLEASSGQRPGILLNILKYTGQPPITKNYPPKISIVLGLRNPVLKPVAFFMVLEVTSFAPKIFMFHW